MTDWSVYPVLDELKKRIEALEQEVARLKNNKPRYAQHITQPLDGSADTTAIPRFAEARMKEIEENGA